MTMTSLFSYQISGVTEYTMLLCLDVGNTHIFGGLFADAHSPLTFPFRYPSRSSYTSDELGIFLKAYLREMGVLPEQISAIAICSVVPSLDYSIRSAFVKYFNQEPFILDPKSQHVIGIQYDNPQEMGADRIANAIAARHLFPNQHCIIVDLGSATTFEVVSKKGVCLGGAILPGLQMQSRALNEYTAVLPPVRIQKMGAALGHDTQTNIQSGLYYGHLGAMQAIIQSIVEKAFENEPAVILGTGGFASLYEQSNIFSELIPDLVLQGLKKAYFASLLKGKKEMTESVTNKIRTPA